MTAQKRRALPDSSSIDSSCTHPPRTMYPELKTLPSKTQPIAKAIFPLPAVRTLELRSGKILKGLEKGKVNLEASLGQVRGTVPSAPCIRCARTVRVKGPFTTCIVVPGQFDGACCNCRYNDDGSGCDFSPYVRDFHSPSI
jgi:hypothetical protein